MGKRMNQDRICLRAVFSVSSERAVEKRQGVRLGQVRRMGPILVIFVAILAGICSIEGDSYGYGAIGKFQ